MESVGREGYCPTVRGLVTVVTLLVAYGYDVIFGETSESVRGVILKVSFARFVVAKFEKWLHNYRSWDKYFVGAELALDMVLSAYVIC